MEYISGFVGEQNAKQQFQNHSSNVDKNITESFDIMQNMASRIMHCVWRHEFETSMMRLGK
jgi:hypothetical protein